MALTDPELLPSHGVQATRVSRTHDPRGRRSVSCFRTGRDTYLGRVPRGLGLVRHVVAASVACRSGLTGPWSIQTGLRRAEKVEIHLSALVGVDGDEVDELFHGVDERRFDILV